MEQVTSMAAERPVVIFSKSTCPMSFTVESLFLEFGVNPAIHDLDQLPSGWGHEIENALSRLGCNPSIPAVFIGGKLVGGTNEVMSLHLKRSLIPMLKRVGALWV
ncbi:monothiol glutaredoxin-S2-like [Impatiens glandulifera]|uniref:monothiol glutaredoxin-S2-like n=1 Tax=Impatiens glandulifera TaxID=253017 RepID=UPI001FB0BB1C|nr:monothiol glutaredoxin-S2-like [Impatiens glandulifera]